MGFTYYTTLLDGKLRDSTNILHVRIVCVIAVFVHLPHCSGQQSDNYTYTCSTGTVLFGGDRMQRAVAHAMYTYTYVRTNLHSHSQWPHK